MGLRTSARIDSNRKVEIDRASVPKRQYKLDISAIKAPYYDTYLGCMNSNLGIRGAELCSFHFSKSI